tara:strand:+ start:9897 stop:10409 length:513 start_codon:yes stop_codon:yes gene_type:complete
MSNGRSRWIGILLACSLAVNLLLLGAFLGRFFGERPYPGAFPPHMGWVLRGLPEEERQHLRPVLRKHQRRAASLQRELADAQGEATKQLRSEELDEQDLQDALSRLRAASNASQQAMHDTLVEVMQQLEPQRRKEVMLFMRGDWRREMRRRGEGRRGRRPGPPVGGPLEE